MRNTINTFNERLEKQNQSKNIKIKKVELPSINTKENQLNILQYILAKVFFYYFCY